MIIAALDAGVPLRDVRFAARGRGRWPDDRHVRRKLAFPNMGWLAAPPPADRDLSHTARIASNTSIHDSHTFAIRAPH